MAAAVEKDASDTAHAKEQKTRIASTQRILDEKKKAYDRQQRKIQRKYPAGDDDQLFTSTMPKGKS